MDWLYEYMPLGFIFLALDLFQVRLPAYLVTIHGDDDSRIS